jgi:hypothetical protein
MAIAVGTNSQTSSFKAVALPALSVVGYTSADLVESAGVTKTPLTTNVPQTSTYYTGTAYTGTTTTNYITTREIWITG